MQWIESPLPQEYIIEGRFLPALNELVQRHEPLTMEETVQIDLEIGFKVACTQERFAMQKASCMESRITGGKKKNLRQYKGGSIEDIDFSHEIRATFGRPVGPFLEQTPLNASRRVSIVLMYPVGTDS